MVSAIDGFHGTPRFVVEGHLGEGGMGAVHRARDVERGETVALKTMTHLDPGSLLRFKREFRALADISHPNVVQLYELFSEGEHWFFTMELVDGSDLLTWLRPVPEPPTSRRAPRTTVREAAPSSGDPFVEDCFGAILPEAVPPSAAAPGSSPSLPASQDAARLRDAFRQLASGVQAIHAAGKLHRDIKPSNVMVTSDGRVVLLDFGLVGEYARDVDPGASDGILVGTPAYMAPEQAAQQAATPASDWYSVGVILFEALTGRLPFEGSTSDVLLSKLQPLAAPPSAFVEGVPADLAKLCLDLLQLDPRARPRGVDIIRRLEGEPTTAAPASRQAPFVGRREQLSALHAAFEASRTNDVPVLVTLGGRSGMGKSALASQFLGALASLPDVLVLSARCYERETVPFKAVDQVVDELSRWLSLLHAEEAYELLPHGVHALTRLFPVLRNVSAVSELPDPDGDVADPIEVRRRAFAAFKDLLDAISGHRSLVIHIGDVHWGDPDSVQLLESLLSPRAPRPLLLLCDHRTEAAASSEALAAFGRMRGRLAEVCDFRDVEVGELSFAEAQGLAKALLEHGDGSTPDAVAREAQGSPLFVAELARWANERREVTRGAVALEQVVLARVAELTPEARALLEAISVARGPIETAVAERAAGLQGHRRSAAMALRAARFVSTGGLRDDDVLETAHDRIRETVAASLDDTQRQARHSSLARAIAGSTRVDAEAALEHFLAAGDEPSARRYALEAARAAEGSLAFLRAATLYRTAIALRAASLEALYARLGDALANAGRSADAADAYMEAATHASWREANRLRRIAAEHYLKSGRDEKGLDVLRGVLEEAGIRYPESREGAIASMVLHEARLRLSTALRRASRLRRPQRCSPRLLARIDAAFCAATGLSLRDPLRASYFGLCALNLALMAGEPVRLGRALAVAAGNAAARGEAGRRRAEELVSASQRVAAQLDDPHAHALAHLGAGMVHFFLGEWRDARAKLDEADAILRDRCRAVAWELAHAEVWSCNALILSGELGEAALRIAPALDAAYSRDDLFAVIHLTYPACISHIVADDVDAAWRVAQHPGPEEGFTPAEFGVFISACSVERYKGDGKAAWARAERAAPLLDGSDLMRVAVIRAFAAYERGLCAIASATQGHDRARALRAANHFGRTLARERVPYARAMGYLVHAGAQAARGDEGRAAKALDAAVPLLDAADLGYLAACARYRRAQLVGGEAAGEEMERCCAFFAAQGVANVERCLAMSAPGFEDLS
jgi:serine/threonine protein kinase/tetratricopeptide (TPR) repeat protein